VSTVLPEAHRIASDEEAISIARDYADSIAPGAIERDRERQIPVDELERLGKTGLLALGVPVEHGGPGATVETIVEVSRLISVADASIGQVPQNHFQLVDFIVRHGDDTQKELILGDVVRGARLGNAISERGGRNAIDLKTVLRPDGDGYRLDGRKYYSTGALTAQWVPVLAKGPDDVLAFVYVPRDSDGLEVDQDWTAFGQRATISGTTVLDNVAVRPEWVLWLQEPEKADTWSAFGQILQVVVDVGIARAALDEAVWFLREKSRPFIEAVDVERAADEPYAVEAMGRLSVKVRAAEALMADAARRLDESAARPEDQELVNRARLGVAEARAFGAETALEVSTGALDTLGTSAADEKYGFDRHWRNARTHTSHDPTRWKHVHLGRSLVQGIDPAPNSFLI
jgi:SfnB family sulfur acquisition oxidoreductase